MAKGLDWGLATAIAGLAAAIALELRTPSVSEAMLPLPRPAMAKPASAAPARVDLAEQWVASILARPLFSPSRRPGAAAAPPPVAAVELPRLSGILVTSEGKAAIFTPPGQKPIVAHEGGQVGDYVVRSILAQQVTLRGPDGDKTLRPAYEAKPAEPMPITRPARYGQAAVDR